MHLMAQVFTGGKIIYLSVLQLQARQLCVKDTLSSYQVDSPAVGALRHMSFRGV